LGIREQKTEDKKIKDKRQMKTEKRIIRCAVRQLTVLSVLLPAVLASCEGLDNGSGKGQETVASFSLGGIAPWGASTELRGASATPRVVETASVPLEGNWVLEASLVEDPAVPTRAFLNTDVIVHIIARNSTSEGEVAGEKDYKSNGDGSLDPVNADDPMLLESGKSYFFTAYSYNASVATTLPANFETTVTLNPYVGNNHTTAEIGNDLLLGVTSTATQMPSTTGISLGTLTHRFSQVKYAVGNVIKLSSSATTPTLTLDDVSLTNNYQATLTKGATTLAAALAKSADKATDQLLDENSGHIVYTGGEPPVLKISGSLGNQNFDNISVSYKKSLVAGYSYTLRITARETPCWAGSNIYWDGTRLTFSAPGTDDKQYYQGVFFRWGSLVGISPVQTNSRTAFAAGTNGNLATGTPIYVPPVPGGPTNWTQTNLTTAQSAPYSSYFSSYHTSYYYDFDKIPYNTGEESLGTTSPTYDPGAFKGDICRYLTGQSGIPGGAWVMPTLADFESASRSHWTGSVPNSTYWYRQTQENGIFPTTNNNALTDGYPDGTYHDWTWGASYCQNGTVLPASGHCGNFDGTVMYTGYRGYYWSSSVIDANWVSFLDFYSDGVYTYKGAFRGIGLPVRCVLDH
jgi:hypothetical protein